MGPYASIWMRHRTLIVLVSLTISIVGRRRVSSQLCADYRATGGRRHIPACRHCGSRMALECIPACGFYLLIHIAEGEIITPLLTKRFTLNPVVVIVSLFFWHALWGVPGALLAVPLIAMFKIASDRIEVLQPAGHIIGA